MRILTIILLFISFGASAQSIQNTGNSNTVSHTLGGIWADSAVVIPVKDTNTTYNTLKKHGRILVATNDSNFYYHNGNQYVRMAKYSDVQGLVGDTSTYQLKSNLSQNLSDSNDTVYPSNGAVDRSLWLKQDKLSVPYVNPRDFGAVGDSVTDDYAAIQAAFNTGKDVFSDSGRYRVSQTVRPIRSQQKWFGSNNTEIHFKNITAYSVDSPLINCIVDGITFYGSNKDSNFTDEYAIKWKKTYANTATGVVLRNVANSGIYIDSSVSYTGGNQDRIGNTVINCFAYRCNVGVNLAPKSQYNSVINIKGAYNDSLVSIYGGNNFGIGGNGVLNTVGVFLSTEISNDAHALWSGGSFNHNTKNLVCLNVINSYIFDGVSFQAGGIDIVNSPNIVLTDGMITGPISNVGSTGFTISGNNMLLTPSYSESGGGTHSFFCNKLTYASPTAPDIALWTNCAGNTPLQSVVSVGNSSSLPIAFTTANATELFKPVTFPINSLTTASVVFKHPTIATSGGVILDMEIEGLLYGTPATTFKALVSFYPNTATAISTAGQSAGYIVINGGSIPSNRISASITPDGQYGLRIFDTASSLPAGSWVRINSVNAHNTGSQAVNSSFYSGWTAVSSNTNVGYTSVRELTPTFNLNSSTTAANLANNIGVNTDISATAITTTSTLSTSKMRTVRQVSAASGAVTLTWNPTTAGQQLQLIRTDATANVLTVRMNSGNINGIATNTSMISQYNNLTLVWDGTNSFAY